MSDSKSDSECPTRNRRHGEAGGSFKLNRDRDRDVKTPNPK
jgi:hypothetical protein